MEFDFSSCKAGDALPESSIGPISNLQLVKWAAGSGDFNPIHFDLNVAKKQGLENVLVHGPFKSAFVISSLMELLGAGGYIKKVSSTYTGMDISGNTLTLRAVVTDRRQEAGEILVFCDYTVVNQLDKPTVKGSAVLAVL